MKAERKLNILGIQQIIFQDLISKRKNYFVFNLFNPHKQPTTRLDSKGENKVINCILVKISFFVS